MKILDIINELNIENGSNYKIKVLKKYKDNEVSKLLKRVLKLTYDKATYIFGISMKNVNYQNQNGDYSLESALDILEERFCTRLWTGNKAIEELTNLLTILSSDDAKVLELIIGRDLKIGIGRTNINKVFKGLIGKSVYMRCDLLTKTTSKNINLEDFYCQLKSDGTYRETQVFSCNSEFYSRSSNEYFYSNFKKITDNFPDGYYHGEMTVHIDEEFKEVVIESLKSKKDASKLIQEIEERWELGNRVLPRNISNGLLNSDDVPFKYIHYDLWDYITPDDYYLATLKDRKNLPRIPYKDRLTKLREILDSDECKENNINVIEMIECTSLDEAMKWTSEKMKLKFEGSIVKDKNMLFKDGTSKQQLKVKLKIELDLRILGFVEGNKGSKNEEYFSAIIVENDEGTIKSQIGVSSMTEDERDWFHENRETVTGKVLEVQANDLSVSSTSGIYKLSHPRYMCMKDDKNETDTLVRALKIRENAMLLK